MHVGLKLVRGCAYREPGEINAVLEDCKAEVIDAQRLPDEVALRIQNAREVSDAHLGKWNLNGDAVRLGGLFGLGCILALKSLIVKVLEQALAGFVIQTAGDQLSVPFQDLVADVVGKAGCSGV